MASDYFLQKTTFQRLLSYSVTEDVQEKVFEVSVAAEGLLLHLQRHYADILCRYLQETPGWMMPFKNKTNNQVHTNSPVVPTVEHSGLLLYEEDNSEEGTQKENAFDIESYNTNEVVNAFLFFDPSLTKFIRAKNLENIISATFSDDSPALTRRELQSNIEKLVVPEAKKLSGEKESTIYYFNYFTNANEKRNN